MRTAIDVGQTLKKFVSLMIRRPPQDGEAEGKILLARATTPMHLIADQPFESGRRTRRANIAGCLVTGLMNIQPGP